MARVDDEAGAGAFEAAVRGEVPRLFRLALSVLRDAGEAEDAVQDTLVRAWRAWGTIRDPDRTRSWLTSICIHHCISRRRGPAERWRHHRQLDEVTATALPPDAGDVDLDRACRLLSRRQLAVITLHYHHGYGLDECGRLMGCRPGTVRSHLGRALATLRRELDHG